MPGRSRQAERTPVERLLSRARQLFVAVWEACQWRARAVWVWIKMGGPIWLFVSVYIAVWLIANVSSSNQMVRARVGATLLQLAGVLLVAWGIHQTRLLFGKRPLTEWLKAWFRPLRAIFRKRKPIVATGVSSGAGAGGSVEGYILKNPNDPNSITDRLDALEANLKSTITRLDETRASIHRESRAMAARLASARQQMEFPSREDREAS